MNKLYRGYNALIIYKRVYEDKEGVSIFMREMIHFPGKLFYQQYVSSDMNHCRISTGFFVHSACINGF